MAINSIYKYLKESKLNEQLRVDGLTFLGKGYGYELYNATSFQGAQALTVGETEQLAGEGYTSSESTFNAHINDTLKLYFFVREGTNHVFMGCLSDSNLKTLSIIDRDLVLKINFMFQNVEGGAEIDDEILPLYLLPNLRYEGHDGLLISENKVLGNYKGLIDPDHTPTEVVLENISEIKQKAFKDYPIPNVVIEGNVERMRSGAFTGYTGTIKCAAETFEETGWPSDWADRDARIVWGIHLTPEEIARRLQAAKDLAKATLNDYAKPEDYREAEQQRLAEIMRDANTAIDACEIPADTHTEVEKAKELINDLKTKEQYEAEEAERRRIELQAAETLSVLRYKQNGNEITILGCKPGREKLDIPSEINGKPVTTIGPFAFYENTTVTEINLPETIKLIGKAAFYGCSNLVLKYPKSATLYTDAIKGVRRTYPF